jgi:predicted ArsR family transcriptional regulator
VDREPLNPTDFASAVTAITSAFGDPTRRAIYLHAHETPDGVTASAVAQRFDLHPNVARHHLDKLAAGGYLDVAVSRGEGQKAGRPSKRYRAMTPTIDLDIAVRHDDIMISLLGKALSRLGPDAAAELAEEVGVEYGRHMAAQMGDPDGQRSFRTALHAVADALSAHGFAAHAEQSGNQLRIVSEHCPFGDTAIEHPVICAVDRGMVAGMLESLYGDTTAEIESSVALGGDQCVTAVEA